MANWYYYDKDGIKIGPIGVTAIKALAQQGVITAETVIENEQGKTAKAGNVKGFVFPPPQPIFVPLPPVTNNPFEALNQSVNRSVPSHNNIISEINPTLAPPSVSSIHPSVQNASGVLFRFKGLTARLDIYDDKIMIVRDSNGYSLPSVTLHYENIASVKLVKSWWAMRGSIFFAPPGAKVKTYASLPSLAHLLETVVFLETDNDHAQKVYDFVDKKLRKIHGLNYVKLPVYAWTPTDLIMWVIAAIIIGIVGGGMFFSFLESFI